MVTRSANVAVPLVGRDSPLELQRRTALANPLRAIGLGLGDLLIRWSESEAPLPRIQQGRSDEVGFWMWVCMSRGF